MNLSRNSVVYRVGHAALVSAALWCAGSGLGADEKADLLEKRIDQLVAQLGDEDYYVRRHAQDELLKLGFEAFDALTAAETHEDLEIATRAKYLLRLMRVQWTTADDPAEVKKCLENYEFQNSNEKLSRIKRLATLEGQAGIPALCRLVRFERSALLSKWAAVEILGMGPPDKPLPVKQAEILRANLGRSRRPAAKWLLTYLRFGDDPKAALAEWNQLVETERATLLRTPDQTRSAIVVALIRFQINWLTVRGRRDEALTAMRTLIDLERSDSESLPELVEWLVDEKAWEVVAEVADRFASRFANDPSLLYTLAQAYAAQGKTDLAEQAAQRALKLHPGNQVEQLVAHLLTAYNLRDRGLFDWAEREFRHVITLGAPGHNYTVTAHYGLSEMFHDQARELQAAELLQEVVRFIDQNKLAAKEFAGRTAGEVRSRMHYFFAMHWAGKGDRAKQRRHLDEAIQADPNDVDVLIACYRLPNPTPEYRAKVLEAIKTTASKLREDMGAEPDEANAYNQFAWLIGNTEGDYDEALKCSRKSIELKPDYGGFYDTLARCYYAKGDYANAVKFQTKAVEMEPHSGQIARQFELFKKALEKKKKKEEQKGEKEDRKGD